MTTPKVSVTTTKKRKQYEDRWSAYGANTGILKFSDELSTSSLRRFELFQPYDDSFLATLAPDISVARWSAGSILYEEGSYLDLAFYVIEGQIELFFKKQQQSEPIFNSIRLPAPGYYTPESVRHAGLGGRTVFQKRINIYQERRKKPPSDEISFLVTRQYDPSLGETVRLGRKDFFGEIGAMNGWPQSVTARTLSDCTLMQIRLPALREMKHKSVALKDRLDAIYRKRTLFTQLKTTPLLNGVDDASIDIFSQDVALVSCPPEAVVTTEGEPADALYLVSSGFIKLTQRVGIGEMTVSYLSKGMTLGETELLIDELGTWRFTGTSSGYAELIKIPRKGVRSLLEAYPAVEDRLWNSAVARIKESGRARRNLDLADLIDFSLTEGLVQGNSMLVIDLDVCTRCDDCVLGCAATHRGRPRFVREGEKYQNFLIARSCYHCEDPVCLIGCPTGAILRANIGDVVKIDDNLCIGCANCAQKCPYGAIVMFETGQLWPDSDVPEQLRGQNRIIASKCDLCLESSTGPACINNCPHSCAFRIASLDDFQQLLELNEIQY